MEGPVNLLVTAQHQVQSPVLNSCSYCRQPSILYFDFMPKWGRISKNEETGRYSEAGQVRHRVINSQMLHMRTSSLPGDVFRLWISLQAEGVKAVLLRSLQKDRQPCAPQPCAANALGSAPGPWGFGEQFKVFPAASSATACCREGCADVSLFWVLSEQHVNIKYWW